MYVCVCVISCFFSYRSLIRIRVDHLFVLQPHSCCQAAASDRVSLRHASKCLDNSCRAGHGWRWTPPKLPFFDAGL